MTDAPNPSLPVCPPWCSWPAGHPYTDEASATEETPGGTAVKAGYVVRYHEDALNLGEVAPVSPSASFSGFAESPVSTTISCEEQAIDDNGPAVRAPARIILWTENPALTAEEARAVAALLCRAADRLEALTVDGAS